MEICGEKRHKHIKESLLFWHLMVTLDEKNPYTGWCNACGETLAFKNLAQEVRS